MTDHDSLDMMVARLDFVMAAVEEGSLEVSHDLYRRILGPRFGRTPEA